MIVSRTFVFDAAHSIPSHAGRCQRKHGHRWKVEVALKGKYEPEDVMLVDFGVIKEIVNRTVISRLDHTDLDDVFKEEASAENIALWIYRQLDIELFKIYDTKVSLYYIKVWESEDCYAQVGGQ